MDERPSAYIETSVISYLVARPSRDAVVYAHQIITAEWWELALPRLRPCVSRYVIDEASRGDPMASARRLEAIKHVDVLPTSERAERLARLYIEEGAVPATEPLDALHLALASYHSVDYLVTWNCKHIAAAAVRRQVAELNAREGYFVPMLCTPEELMEF